MNDFNPITGELRAVSYIDTELAQAQVSLKRARLWALVTVIFVLGYSTFLAVTLYTRLLQPKPAAQTATHYIATVIEREGPRVSQQLIHDVPAIIDQAPDYLLAQLPVLRADFEAKLEKSLADYNQQITPQFTAMMDDLLVKNRSAIRSLIGQARNPKAANQLGEQFEKQVLAYIDAKGPDGVSAMDRLTQTAQAMNVAEARMHRLAYADDLTPEEKRLRRIWGLLLQQANRSDTKKATG